MRKFLGCLILAGGLFIVAFLYLSLGWSESYDAKYKTATLIAVPILLALILSIVVKLWTQNGIRIQLLKPRSGKGKDKMDRENK
jgi:membrane protease YdiL (CAAX protease family)